MCASSTPAFELLAPASGIGFVAELDLADDEVEHFVQ
jgi:hypothetical protein